MITEPIFSQMEERTKNDGAFLSKFTKRLSGVKSRRQLFNLISRDIGSYLNVEYSTIFLVDSEREKACNYFRNETLADPDDPFLGSVALQGYNGQGSTTMEFIGIGHQQCLDSYIKPEKYRAKAGGLVIDLTERELVFAQWVILDGDDQPGLQKQIELLKLLANLLCLALHRIDADEKIGGKNAENELLQSLNIDFASIRDKNDLLKILQYELKKFFEFGYHWLTVLHEDQLTMSTFLQDSFAVYKNTPCYEEAIKVRYPVNDNIFNKVLAGKDPIIFNTCELNETCTLPGYMQVLHSSGVKYAVMTSLQVASKVIGVWTICLMEGQQVSSKQQSLIKSLSSQLSVAMSNIIANQDIADREKEKSRLLSFSNSIASVRDKSILGRILKEQLKDLFNIRNYVIHVLSEDQQKLTPFVFDPDADLSLDADLHKLADAPDHKTDGIFHQILINEDPVIFDTSDGTGLVQITGAAIRLGQDSLAVITFIPEDQQQFLEQCRLFKCIISQIGLTISNLLASEKIICQLTEINNYKLLLEEEKIYLKEEIETTLNYDEIVGESACMQKTFRLVSQVASSDSTVLILGETGTGKELIARAIHNNSPRKNKLMVKVNCAALPANLIESELFGHERGSFTGATERRLGKFELANNGTLFLDEIGDMPLELQVKLLRALQEREIERVGGRTTIKVDVRIIAATNRDLEKEMAEGRFRSDLYYRLNIFPITLPSLRERKEDIPQLALYFIERFAKKSGKEINTLTNRALHELNNYDWPGNIRELEHLMERSVLLSTGNTIKQINLPNQNNQTLQICTEEDFVIKTIDENERDFILKTLKYCNGKIGGPDGAAQLLGVPTSTLNSKMKRLGIKKDHHL